MSPSLHLVRTAPWICTCCGEIARGARPPRDCTVCGRPGRAFERQREASLPSD